MERDRHAVFVVARRDKAKGQLFRGNTMSPRAERKTLELPYHRWPVAYDPKDWKAGSLIRCEGEGCQWCAAGWKLVDPHTLEDMPEGDMGDGSA